MTSDRLGDLLQDVAAGVVTPGDARARLSASFVEDLGYAQVDHLRPLSQGAPEIVFGQGKTTQQVVGICRALADRTGSFLVTRAEDVTRTALRQEFPPVEVNDLARTVFLRGAVTEREARGTVLIVTAGTADLAVAEEAAVVADALGNPVERLNDVGVAGIHRVLARADELRSASVIVVVAGMDGALASVVGGLVARPVIAVPTSIGYGAAFDGLSALLAMLNSCAAGVCVVNIDSGFAAAAAATRINQRVTG